MTYIQIATFALVALSLIANGITIHSLTRVHRASKRLIAIQAPKAKYEGRPLIEITRRASVDRKNR